MKLTLYKKVLSMAKEAVEASLVPIRAMQMKKQAELEIAKIEERIITQEAKIQELTAKYPIEFDRVLDAIDTLELLQRRMRKFEDIKSQLFGDEK